MDRNRTSCVLPTCIHRILCDILYAAEVPSPIYYYPTNCNTYDKCHSQVSKASILACSRSCKNNIRKAQPLEIASNAHFLPSDNLSYLSYLLLFRTPSRESPPQPSRPLPKSLLIFSYLSFLMVLRRPKVIIFRNIAPLPARKSSVGPVQPSIFGGEECSAPCIGRTLRAARARPRQYF